MLEKLMEKWTEVLETLRQENEISDVAFDTWVKYFKPISVENGMITVKVDKENLIVNESWFTKKYRLPLILAVAQVIEEEYNVCFITFEDSNKCDQVSEIRSEESMVIELQELIKELKAERNKIDLLIEKAESLIK